ncbi:YetF domain-containing protein [Alkaliphilus serpentinus]|uniref:DUF421 domain-containing protein n=1 Tax=Alkaliphilus serpentinus TaxID=1482731 RepID=A0A833HMP8_9FIRM|nr:DUF421 domain-containing protein [Alkaliphilus serpentinus]KAB3528850.1 DUF421 domain-containing protein [Alkaliphilus serpentinus]
MLDFKELYQAVHHPIIVYILLITLTRIIGKKLLGQLTFFDFVTGITLGTIGGAYVATEVKGYYVLVSAIIMAALVYLTGFLTMKNVTARKLIEGEPIIVVQNGKILEDNMSKVRYNQDDLMMQLREKDVFDYSQVEFAILEPHGKLSVQKKSQYKNITPTDLNIPTQDRGISFEVIRDGRLQEANLKQNNISFTWLYNQLVAKNVKSLEDVFLATMTKEGPLYIDFKKDELVNPQRSEDDDSLI